MHAQNAQIQIILRIFKVSSGHSVLPYDDISRHRRPWSDCADAQAESGPSMSTLPEITFSHGTAHFWIREAASNMAFV